VATAADPADRTVTRGPLGLWLALLAGPTAGAVQLSVNYALVKWACAAHQGWVLAAVAALLLVVTLAGALAGVVLGAAHLVGIRAGDPVADLWSVDSRRLLAVVAIGLDVLFAVFVLNALIAIAVLSPCE
jgi:hypothetical protein